LKTRPNRKLLHRKKTDWKHFLLDLLETVGLAVVLFLVINALSARVRVDGSSMLPTCMTANLYWSINWLIILVTRRAAILLSSNPRLRKTST